MTSQPKPISVPPGLYTRKELEQEFERLTAEFDAHEEPRRRRASLLLWFAIVAGLALYLWGLWVARFDTTDPRAVGTPAEGSAARSPAAPAEPQDRHQGGNER